MSAVLMSIWPKWCELILSGQKTVEVRKTKPRYKSPLLLREPFVVVPFKVYIYCTLPRFPYEDYLVIYAGSENCKALGYCGGKVIGEFSCDRIDPIGVPFPAWRSELAPEILDATCLSYDQLHRYAGHKTVYGWHVSEVKAYDRPQLLDAFGLQRPPVSWCYVEEIAA